MKADFLWFNGLIINKSAIIMIYKYNYAARCGEGYVERQECYGICARLHEDMEENEYYIDESERDRRIEALIKMLCYDNEE